MRIICHGLKDEDFPVVFDDHKISLGRDAANGIVVPAEEVSARHAVLTEEGNDIFIQDNGSVTGTYLNYSQVKNKRKLSNGDVIQIGGRLIQVVFSPGGKVLLNFAMKAVSADDSVATPDPEPAPVAPARKDSPDDATEHTLVAPETSDSGRIFANSPFPGGAEIGKYVILKRLGRGGMGEVYLARHKSLGILRALKVLTMAPGKDNSVIFERFIREAKLALEIRHPNVVGVMDVETDSSSGYPYIVMEYIDGGSLRDSLRTSKKLSEEQAVVIVEAIASALQTAEEHNIVHRDIKPDNIMFTKRGEVKLADLGIAKSRGRDISLTQTNVMIGTPAYLPPEQARNAKEVDARADIYSLGATFYEMLTGELPYPGEDTIEILHKLLSNPVPNPRKSNPAVSPASAAIVMKMLAKSPQDRFQNAKELLVVMERTFPPHTSNESSEVIKGVLSGERRNNEAFNFAISSTHIPMPGKRKLAVLAFALFICCIVCFILWLIFALFVPKKQDNGTEPTGGGNSVTHLIGTFFGVNTMFRTANNVVTGRSPDDIAEASIDASKIADAAHETAGNNTFDNSDPEDKRLDGGD